MRIRAALRHTRGWSVRLLAPLSLTHARARACRATLAPGVLAIIKRRARSIHVRATAAPAAAGTRIPACMYLPRASVRACVHACNGIDDI